MCYYSYGMRFAGAIGAQEVLKAIRYNPGLQDSGDLEPATKTITATSKQAVSDYSTNLAVPAPPAELTVLRLGLRLQVTIDSFGGSPVATRLNYSIEVNGVERGTGHWTSAGAQFAGIDLLSGQFNLGIANAIRIYLWVDQGNAVVSLCQVWLGVGTAATGGHASFLRLTHTGFFQCSVTIARRGTGAASLTVLSPYIEHPSWTTIIKSHTASGDIWGSDILGLSQTDIAFWIGNRTVATDLWALGMFSAILRREE